MGKKFTTSSSVYSQMIVWSLSGSSFIDRQNPKKRTKVTKKNFFFSSELHSVQNASVLYGGRCMPFVCVTGKQCQIKWRQKNHKAAAVRGQKVEDSEADGGGRCNGVTLTSPAKIATKNRNLFWFAVIRQLSFFFPLPLSLNA